MKGGKTELQWKINSNHSETYKTDYIPNAGQTGVSKNSQTWEESGII